MNDKIVIKDEGILGVYAEYNGDESKLVLFGADKAEDCTHKLRKLFWALGDYFKIPSNGNTLKQNEDYEAKIEKVRNYINTRGNRELFTKGEIKEIIYMLTRREIDL